jgi:hypothetical protein
MQFSSGFGAGRFMPLTKMGPWANRGEICFCFGAYLLGAFSEEAIGPFGFHLHRVGGALADQLVIDSRVPYQS